MKAPKIIKEDMFKNLQPGSVIYDLAALKEETQFLLKLIKLLKKIALKF